MTDLAMLQFVAADSIALAREVLPGDRREPERTLPVATAMILVGISLLEIHQGPGCGKREAHRLASIFRTEAPP